MTHRQKQLKIYIRIDTDAVMYRQDLQIYSAYFIFEQKYKQTLAIAWYISNMETYFIDILGKFLPLVVTIMIL